MQLFNSTYNPYCTFWQSMKNWVTSNHLTVPVLPPLWKPPPPPEVWEGVCMCVWRVDCTVFVFKAQLHRVKKCWPQERTQMWLFCGSRRHHKRPPLPPSLPHLSPPSLVPDQQGHMERNCRAWMSSPKTCNMSISRGSIPFLSRHHPVYALSGVQETLGHLTQLQNIALDIISLIYDGFKNNNSFYTLSIDISAAA